MTHSASSAQRDPTRLLELLDIRRSASTGARRPQLAALGATGEPAAQLRQPATHVSLGRGAAARGHRDATALWLVRAERAKTRGAFQGRAGSQRAQEGTELCRHAKQRELEAALGRRGDIVRYATTRRPRAGPSPSASPRASVRPRRRPTQMCAAPPARRGMPNERPNCAPHGRTSAHSSTTWYSRLNIARISLFTSFCTAASVACTKV